MTLFLIGLAAAVVIVIALVSVGGVTQRLAEQPPPSFFDLDEAVGYVAERLPFEVTAHLSYDDVRALLGWHLDYLEGKGVAAETELALLEGQETGSGPVVAADSEGVAYVLGQAEEASLDVDDVQVVIVLEAEMDYLRAIGAIGSAVEPPADPG